MSQSPPEFKVSKSADYRPVQASGIFGILSSAEGQIIFYIDRLEPRTDTTGKLSLGVVNRELQVEVHMSPAVFKAVAEWMVRHVKDLEDKEKQQIGTVKLEQPPSTGTYA